MNTPFILPSGPDRIRRIARQTGVVLISTLIFLLVITLFSLFAIRRVTLQEKAVGNLMERQMALQAADLATRRGEFIARQISDQMDLLRFTENCNEGAADQSLQGMCRGLSSDAWKSFDWEDRGQTVTEGAAMEKFADAPRFFIEYENKSKPMPGEAVSDGTGPKSILLRVVSRGVGKRSDTVVMTEEVLYTVLRP